MLSRLYSQVRRWLSADPSPQRGTEYSQSDESDPTITEVQIEQMIVEAGGRVWQQDLVDRSDYSPATVSRHLNCLEDDERIKRVKIGREKIVCLPDNVPAAGSART